MVNNPPPTVVLTIPPQGNLGSPVTVAQLNGVIVQLNKVLAQMLAINNDQGLQYVNPYTPIGAPNPGDVPVWDITKLPHAYRPKSPKDLQIG